MKRIISIILSISMIALMVFAFSGCNSNNKKYENGNPHVKMVVKNYGTIVFELDPSEAPITVEHFLKLVKNGDYNNTYIHRYQKGFVMQGGHGCKNTETIKGEFSDNGVENNIKHERGVLSMARSTSPDSASAEFFIVTDTSSGVSKSLDGKYAAFGKIVDGMDVLEKIEKSITSDMFEYSIQGIYMGFLDSKYYILIEKMEVVD